MTSTALLSPRRPVLADLVPGARVRDAALIGGGAALTGLLAQVAVPLPGTPVPFTLQTLGALLVGAGLGSRRGAASMALYLLAGLAGVPWFAGAASGPSPALGYVVGFVPAAALVGALARRGADRTVPATIALMAAGSAAIYLVGATWLALDLHVDPAQALRLGVWPFLAGDAVKAAVASLALPGTWAVLNHRRQERS